MKRNCILVLGAHRSGTSALARTLSLLGADLPTNLLDPQPDNPTGFWESGDHVTLNDELLSRIGLRWDSFVSARWDLLDRSSFDGYRDRLVELLHRDFESSGLFIAKDPRICRLLPLWRAALQHFDTEPKCILIVRHPLEVAGSLTARNAIPLQTGLLIWLVHLLEAEAGSRDLGRVFVSYELLLNDWRAAALRISQSLNIEWPRTVSEAAPDIDKFLQRDAQHHLIGGLTSSEIESTAPIRAIRRAYEVASAAARGKAADICVVFDELLAFVSESESLIRPAIAESQRLLADNQRLRREAVAESQRLIADNEQLRREAVAESQRLIADNEQLRREALAESQRLIADNEQLRREALQRGQVNERLRSNVAQLRDVLPVWERELNEKVREIAELQETAASVGARLNWREEQVEAFDAELKWRETVQNEELRRVRAGQHRIAQLDTELSDLRGSLTWRLTAPLREAYHFCQQLRRTVWAQAHRFRLEPVQQLSSINRNLWKAEGSDPQFLLVPTSRPERLPTSWCEIDIGLDHDDGPQQGILYFDDASGLAGATMMLPHHERGQLRTAIELPVGVRGLRLVPRQKPGRFEVKDVLIREITRKTAKRIKQASPPGIHSVRSGASPQGSEATQPAEVKLAQPLNSESAPSPIEPASVEQIAPVKPASNGVFASEGTTVTEDAPQSIQLQTNEQRSATNSSPAPSIKDVVRNRLKAEYAAFLAGGAELGLPQPRSPLTSIVLVLYNHAELTYNCLCSIVAHAGNDSEVIVVDNASTDSTVELLKRIRGAIVVRNAENLYFPRACNQGSEHAQGKYLLLLNNDAQLLPGSLRAATSVLEQDEDAGAVGGRILNLSGQLQEAGCIVWSDGRTVGYGRGDTSDLPEYMFRRDVDFCSGAFLLTRTQLFRETGGFDEVFSPGYYEEVDYCVRLWKRNLRVVYEPHAVVVHFEYGSSNSAFAVTLTARNRQILRNKHPDYLVRREAPNLKNAIRARHARAPRLRILFIDDRVPHLDQGSGYPRANIIVNTMVRIGAAVTVFPMAADHESWHQVYRDLLPETEVMANGSADSLAEFLKGRRGDYDVVFVSRPHNMRQLLTVIGKKSLLGRCHLIYDAEAVFALRTQERARIKGDVDSNLAERELLEELELAAEADDIICVSELERRHFVERALGPIHILGHGVETKPTATDFEGRRDILFVGAMNSADSPNEDSVIWFRREVFPLVHERFSEPIRLIVVGQNTRERLSALADDPSVEILGSVEELSPYYERARMFLAPTRFGAGIPIKILEAASRGVPILATSLMATQLGWIDGEQLLTASADDPEQFAHQCVRLYSDKQLWLRLRQEALKRVRDDCSIDQFEQKLKRILVRCRPLGWAAEEDTIPAPTRVKC